MNFVTPAVPREATNALFQFSDAKYLAVVYQATPRRMLGTPYILTYFPLRRV